MRVLFLFILIILCASCVSVNNNPNQNGSVRFVDGEERVQMMKPDKSDTTEAVFSYKYYQNCDSVFKDSANEQIYQFTIGFTESTRSDSIGVLSPQFFNSQLNYFYQMYLSEDGNYHLWEMEGRAKVIDERRDFVQLDLGGWTYTGGAHGNGFSKTVIIDRNSGRVLRLTDFIKDTQELNKIAESEFRILYDLNSEESINEAGFWFENDQFQLNENFSFTESHMCFFYNSYEIAPYSGGPTLLEVPIEKIRHLLNEKF